MPDAHRPNWLLNGLDGQQAESELTPIVAKTEEGFTSASWQAQATACRATAYRLHPRGLTRACGCRKHTITDTLHITSYSWRLN